MNVEIICNVDKEQERMKTLRGFITNFNVTPTFEVYGQDALNHFLFNKFDKNLKISEISLAINHISLFKKHSNSDLPLLIFESDVIANYSFEVINCEISKAIDDMKKYDIDFIFLGQGCVPHFTCDNKITETLYSVGRSRCTESYLVSPNGIKEYLKYFDTTENHVAIDWDFNYFFEKTSICSCWKSPELFIQGSFQNLYPSYLR
jgi:hypothetical protein